MRKTMAVFMLCATLLLVGCGNSTFKKAVEEGKLALANQDYEKAEKMFILALEEKKDDEEINALYAQTSKYIKAMKLFEEGKYEESLILCNKISKIENGSAVIIKEVSSLKEKLNKHIKLKYDIEKAIEEIEKLYEEGKYQDSKEKAEEVVERLEKEDLFKSEINNLNEIIDKCKDKIEEAKTENDNSSNKENEVDNKKDGSQTDTVSSERAVEIVRNMLSSNGGYVSKHIELDHMDGNNYIIHVYDVITNEDESHTATQGWYRVDMYTGKVTDAME